VEGLTSRVIEILEKGGYQTADELLKAPRDALLSLSGIGPKSLDKIEEKVKKVVHGKT
jgi:DNA-directed RNA polymerase alpha subunit